MITPRVLFFAGFLSTVFMTGVIWFVQIVHYPLFRLVPESAIRNYGTVHADRTGWVVAAPMLIELSTAALLLFWKRPTWLSQREAEIGFGLIVLIFLATFLLSVPQHAAIQSTGDPGAVQRLVMTNWVRTVLWTARCVLLSGVVFRLLAE